MHPALIGSSFVNLCFSSSPASFFLFPSSLSSCFVKSLPTSFSSLSYLHLLLLLVSAGIALPLLHHACLRMPRLLPTLRPCQGLLWHPLGCSGARTGPNPTSTPAAVPPPPHRFVSLPVPPSPAPLPSPPAPGLPLTERQARRRRRWQPLYSHPSASSPPHGPAQHLARLQHRCRSGGQLQ